MTTDGYTLKTEKKYKDKIGVLPPELWSRTVTIDRFDFTVGEIVTLGIKLATNKEVSAGYSGAMGDGGAAALFVSLECWLAGLQNQPPVGLSFKRNFKEILKERNPDEHAEYLRLKEIYGD